MKRCIDSVVSSMAIVLLFAAIWLITGCEQENSPVASEQELLLAPRNGNGNGKPSTEGDDEGGSNAGGKGKGNPHTEENSKSNPKGKPTANPHTSSNPTGDPHIDNDVSGVNDNPEKPGKRKGEDKDKGVKSADDDPPEESISYDGTVDSVEGNDIILEDGIVIYTWPKSHGFVDSNENGDNDLLEAFIGKVVTVFGEPVYDDDGKLVAIYAYTIGDIDIRDPGKPPWAGPKL